jgi:hypothetical protein
MEPRAAARFLLISAPIASVARDIIFNAHLVL